MPQTNVQNEKSIRLGSCILRINGTNIGALQNAKLEVEVETSQLKADNAHLLPRKKYKSVKVSCDAWEISIDNIALFDGIGEVLSTPASPKQITGEVLQKSGTLKKGTSFTLKGRQADGSVATAITLKNGSETIASGKYQVVAIDGITKIIYMGDEIAKLNEGGLSVDYTHTPAQNKEYRAKDIIKLLETSHIELENTDADGKKFIVEIPAAYNTKGPSFDFQNDDKLDEVMKYPLEFEALARPGEPLFIIRDEQAI